jgi:hypothetical protein
MSTTASPTATPKQRPRPTGPVAQPPSTPRRTVRPPAPGPAPRPRGATTLFAVPFASAMSDQDAALLSRTLDLTTHLHPKLHPSPTSPGVVRLDFDSGLFLQRGSTEGRWALEGRTWGHPAPSTVHDWHLRAAAAAHRLDPTVTLPPSLRSTRSTAMPSRPLSRAANGRLARIGRHVRGLR